MYKTSLEDTIVAIATPVGSGGIGVVRLSGQKALAVADKIFVGKGKDRPSEFKSFTAHYGWVIKKLEIKNQKSKSKNEIVDEALLTVMRAPRSYTREDIVEISCHGGVVSLRAILNLVLEHGPRLAEPGEFTKRAFLNGRIDLAQAEAVLDIIQSKTDAFLKMSVNQLKGDLTVELESIREQLSDVYTEMEAILNFPEDDVDGSDRRQLIAKVQKGIKRVGQLVASGEHGKILREGIKIVICGRPNVGKSSLLNVLLKQPRAIVSAIAGTTRDTIEETAQIKGIPFQMIDTAGILEPRDPIEKEAVKRSRMSINTADLILFVLDASCPLTGEDKILMAGIKDKNVLIVFNKIDLGSRLEESRLKKFLLGRRILKVSAQEKTAIEELEEAIVENVWHGRIKDSPELLISNVRHLNALKECAACLKRAGQSLHDHRPLELASEDVKTAVDRLDQITGRNIDSDLLDKIFSQFCIGK